MSRTFWVAVGAVGGIAAYRKGSRMAERAKELGPLGTAQVVAHSASTAAGHTAYGLSRLSELQARRDGRVLIGQPESASAPAQLLPAAEGGNAATPAAADESPRQLHAGRVVRSAWVSRHPAAGTIVLADSPVVRIGLRQTGPLRGGGL